MYRTYGKDSDSPPFFSVLEVIALFVVNSEVKFSLKVK
jgi:hypothetical protein